MPLTLKRPSICSLIIPIPCLPVLPGQLTNGCGAQALSSGPCPETRSRSCPGTRSEVITLRVQRAKQGKNQAHTMLKNRFRIKHRMSAQTQMQVANHAKAAFPQISSLPHWATWEAGIRYMQTTANPVPHSGAIFSGPCLVRGLHSTALIVHTPHQNMIRPSQSELHFKYGVDMDLINSITDVSSIRKPLCLSSVLLQCLKVFLL